MKNKQTMTVAAIALVAAGAGFFGGMTYQKNQRPQFGQFTERGFSARGGSGASLGNMRLRNGNGAVTGEIIATDDTSVTVKLADGSSKIVLLGDNTSINKATEGAKSDLVTGVTIAVFGQTNNDGSVMATNVQLNPQMRGPNGPSGTR